MTYTAIHNDQRFIKEPTCSQLSFPKNKLHALKLNTIRVAPFQFPKIGSIIIFKPPILILKPISIGDRNRSVGKSKLPINNIAQD